LYDSSSTITSSVNLVAKWEAEVTFNVNGGSPGTISAQYYTFGATFGPPANPTKTGLSFAGWYQGAAFSNTPAWFASATQYVGGTTLVNSDVTLYAKWEATITYNLSGADTPASLGPDTVDENSNFVKPATDPTKAGTAFTAWAEFGTGIVYTPTTVITKSVTLVPLWGVSIIFDPNGGYSTDSSNISPYNPIVISNVPSTDTFGMIKPTYPTAKTDLTFAGWYYSAVPFSNTPSWFGGATLANDADALNTTRTYYAAWTATVTFDPNNADPISSSTVNENEELLTIKPADPVNSGLTFVGWYDDVLNIEYTDTSLITGDVTLTAHWGHIVTFSTNGGLPSSLPSIKVTDGTGMGVSCPTDPAKPNLHFAGWWDTTQSPAVLYDSTEPITGDITLTAKWVSYVTLVSGSVPTLVEVEEGTSMGTDLPVLPNTAGLTFDGWYLSPALTTKVGSTDIISGDMVLIGKWVAVVSFDLNGGSSAPVSNASYTAGALFVDPGVTVMKGGVAFDGWYDTRFATPVKYVGGSTPVNENVTLYAMWKVTVTFDTKGGAPSVGPLTVSEGTVFSTIKPVDPTKTGLVFDGWWNDALSTPVKYTGTEVITGSITLTAHWRVTITYVSNGGYFTGSTPEVVWEGYSFVLPANPTKSGLTFGGWYYNNSVSYVMGDANWFDTATPCLAGTPINEDTVLVAKWIATVSVNANGGSTVTTPVYVDEGKTLGSGYPLPVTKSNLTFKGWYDISVNPFVEYLSSTPVTKSVTIVALWEATVTFDSDSGTPSYAPATVAEGAAFGTIMPADPSKSGYVFAGWYDGGVRYTYTTPITGNTTLIAKWNSVPVGPVVKYAIMAVSDNNSNISPSGMSTVSVGDSVTYNFSAKSGYNLEVYIDGVLRPELSNDTSYTFHSIGGSHFIEVRGTLSGEGNRGFLHIDTVGHGNVYYSVNGKDYALYVNPIPLYNGYDIKLEAVSESGYYFDSWSGYSSSTASRISVYESGISTFSAGDLYVSANFKEVDDSISFHLWIWILIIIILLILVCILFFLWRREKKERSEYERS
jgi:Listeria/Bacterioides repeat